MRIIAGSFKGKDLRVGHGMLFRPTAQIVRGSIFDTIGGAIEGASFCDLFAGSGAVGIEALSRGAERAVFVEQDKRVLRALRANLEKCGVGRDRATVKIADAFRYIARLVRGNESFDIVFADPPYVSDLAQRVLGLFEGASGGFGGLLIVEHGKPIFLNEGSTLEVLQSKKFGGTMVTYFKRKEGGGRT